LAHFWRRHQAATPFRTACIAGFGGACAIGVLLGLSYVTDSLLLMAPFGATCVLLFSMPKSPMSQPINVLLGHFLSSLVGLLMVYYFPGSGIGIALSVGLAIALMSVFRVTHPPAGADPIVFAMSDFGWQHLFFPVISGSLMLILLAWIMFKRTAIVYPLSVNR